MYFRTIVQSISLCFFLFLLWMAAFPPVAWLPVDFFQRLDPLVFLGSVVSSRQWIWSLFPGLLIIVLTFVLGRFFCGYICPMGITLDISDRMLGSKAQAGGCLTSQNQVRLRKIKYLVLFFILGAGLLGISFVFLASPLSLITRLYGLIFYPALLLAGDVFLNVFMPLHMLL